MRSIVPAEEEWAFGLSVDDEIEWCLCPVYRSKKGVQLDVEGRVKATVPSAVDGRYAGDIQSVIRQALTKARAERSEVFARVTGIGVSIVGLADRRERHLVSIARKRWGPPKKRPVIDFKALFLGLFEQVPSNGNPLINIHNESTAKCLAEWTRQAEHRNKVSSLYYVMFSEGVNAALVTYGQPLFTELHTELGHIWPRPHRIDGNFNTAHTGCRIHQYCFEGLASSQRIARTWAQGQSTPLEALPEEAHDVIAFYVAQLCMNGVLAFSPERILLGGNTLFEGMIPRITQYFNFFNAADTDEPYISYKAMAADGFIRMASIDPKVAGVEAALELGRRVIDNPSLALKISSKPHLQAS